MGLDALWGRMPGEIGSVLMRYDLPWEKAKSEIPLASSGQE
jgi:hypothetical protein